MVINFTGFPDQGEAHPLKASMDVDNEDGGPNDEEAPPVPIRNNCKMIAFIVIAFPVLHIRKVPHFHFLFDNVIGSLYQNIECQKAALMVNSLKSRF